MEERLSQERKVVDHPQREQRKRRIYEPAELVPSTAALAAASSTPIRTRTESYFGGLLQREVADERDLAHRDRLIEQIQDAEAHANAIKAMVAGSVTRTETIGKGTTYVVKLYQETEPGSDEEALMGALLTDTLTTWRLFHKETTSSLGETLLRKLT